MTQKYYRLIDLLSSVISGEWGFEPLDEGSVNIIRTTNFLNNGKINFDNTVKRFVDPGTVSKKKLQSGDVIIEKSGGSPNQPVGRVVYFEKPDDEKYLCNNFTTILRADARISSKYLFYKLFHNHLIKRTLSYQNKTTGIINLQLARYLENEKIILPSLEEQQQTTKILDLAQSLIEKRKQAIAYLDDYIKAVFLDMFGDPVSNPKGWEVVEFEKLVTSIKYGVGSPPQYSEDGYKFIRATDIKKGYIIDSDIKRISPEEANKILKCKLSTNDLIIVRSGVNAGDSAIITKKYDGSFAGYDLIVKLNSLVNPVFIGNLFTSNYLEAEIKPLTRRAAQPHINSDQVKKLKIILPKIETQELFAKKVGQTELLKQKMLYQLKELESNFQAELQRAFTRN